MTQLRNVWLVLCGITLLSWWLGSEHSAPSTQAAALITYGALLITGVKVRLIVVKFMEAHQQSKRLQLAMDAWLLALVVGLAAIYAFKVSMPPV